MNMKGGSMLLPHNKVSGGVQDSQIMIPSFFDRFYVMPPLTNGVHYNAFHVLLYQSPKSERVLGIFMEVTRRPFK